MAEIVFLSLETVSELHRRSLREHGGSDTTTQSSNALYDAMIAIARHELDKPGLAALFRGLFA